MEVKCIKVKIKVSKDEGMTVGEVLEGIIFTRDNDREDVFIFDNEGHPWFSFIEKEYEIVEEILMVPSTRAESEIDKSIKKESELVESLRNHIADLRTMLRLY